MLTVSTRHGTAAIRHERILAIQNKAIKEVEGQHGWFDHIGNLFESIRNLFLPENQKKAETLFAKMFKAHYEYERVRDGSADPDQCQQKKEEFVQCFNDLRELAQEKQNFNIEVEGSELCYSIANDDANITCKVSQFENSYIRGCWARLNNCFINENKLKAIETFERMHKENSLFNTSSIENKINDFATLVRLAIPQSRPRFELVISEANNFRSVLCDISMGGLLFGAGIPCSKTRLSTCLVENFENLRGANVTGRNLLNLEQQAIVPAMLPPIGNENLPLQQIPSAQPAPMRIIIGSLPGEVPIPTGPTPSTHRRAPAATMSVAAISRSLVVEKISQQLQNTFDRVVNVKISPIGAYDDKTLKSLELKLKEIFGQGSQFSLKEKQKIANDLVTNMDISHTLVRNHRFTKAYLYNEKLMQILGEFAAPLPGTLTALLGNSGC